jgi:hypothetical protein
MSDEAEIDDGIWNMLYDQTLQCSFDAEIEAPSTRRQLTFGRAFRSSAAPKKRCASMSRRK